MILIRLSPRTYLPRRRVTSATGWRISHFLVIGALASVAPLAAAVGAGSADTRVTALVEDLLEVSALPSFSVASVAVGEIAFSRAFGCAGLEAGRPAGVVRR
jgi:hypothetical protein